MVTLEYSKLFCHLTGEESAELRRIAREQRFANGQEIFKEGDEGDGVYVVKEGLVEISGLVAPKVRHVFSEVAPGDIFGEMAVLDQKTRSACAVAKGDTVVYFVPREDMLRLVEQSPALAMGLVREISQRLREFNRQYLNEVLQTERLAVLGRFARSIVHDLKNPLNIISITAEMAGMEQATPEFKAEATERIRKQVERISDLIGEILDFTQGAQHDFILAPTDYSSFIGQVIAELRSEVALKSSTLDLDGSVAPAQVLLNPKRLRRVFYNLVHNATDAMPYGGKIVVRVRSNDSEVVTEIEDSGPGIAKEMSGQLFQAFATHGKAHGTGLGLSICKRIIEDHQGWITARNQPGGGAIFSFGLPRRTGG